jgi:nucleoside-diphosphate-sugar epimerase
MKKRLSIVGLGWFGMELAKALSEAYSVFGTKRSVLVEDSEIRILPLSFNPEPVGAPLSEVFDAEMLVLNIPPNSRQENAEDDYRKMMDTILDAIALSPIERAVFVSSTGVFGDHEGRVDEATIPIPTTTGGRILFEAEQKFLSISSCETFVLRPSGLVGGTRHPVKYLAGRKGVGGRLNPINLVHREDLIAMTAGLLRTTELKGRVFHAAAKVHPLKEEYYTTMAQKFGLETPSFDQEDDSKGKEVDAEESKKNLKVKFHYDDPFTMI